MTIYQIIYKLVFRGSLEKTIDLDFETESKAQFVLDTMRNSSVFSKVSYAYIREVNQ